VTVGTERAGAPDVALVDLLDRLLAGGVVITGEVTISLADVDLVHVSLRALISSVSTLVVEP
jgi:Gas vesicle protein